MFGVQNWINVGIVFGIAMVVFIPTVLITAHFVKGVRFYLVSAWVFIIAFIITAIISLFSDVIVGDISWALVFVFATAGFIYLYLYKERAKKRGIQI